MNNFVTDISVAPTWLWIAFTLGIIVLLLIDLSLFGRGNHKVQTKTALLESGIWVHFIVLHRLVYINLWN